MAVTVLALIGGYATASIGVGQTYSTYQGSETTTIVSVPGLSWSSTALRGLNSSVSDSPSCSSGTPCSVTAAGAVDCAGGVVNHTGCLSGDFVEEVTLTTVTDTAFPATLKITIYVTTVSSVTYIGTTFYYTQTSPSNSVAQTITQDFDIGPAPTPISQVTVIVAT